MRRQLLRGLGSSLITHVQEFADEEAETCSCSLNELGFKGWVGDVKIKRQQNQTLTRAKQLFRNAHCCSRCLASVLPTAEPELLNK